MTDFDRLQFGGTTSSFPALKRSGAGLISRLADDSADADFTASTLTASSSAANTSAIASTGYSLTGSSAVSMVDLAGTWNTTGTPTAIKLNVTDTASNAASLLMDLQVGGSSKFNVDKSGNVYGIAASGFNSSNALTYASNNLGFTLNGANRIKLTAGEILFGSTFQLAFSSASSPTSSDLILARDAADTLAQRRGTNAQTFRVYNTLTDASNYERGKIEWASNVLRIGTEKAGTGTARALELQTDGTTRVIVSTGARVTAASVECDDGYLSIFETAATGLARTLAARSILFEASEASSAGLKLRSYMQVGFTSSTISQDVGITADIAISRSAAGKLLITDGSTGAGSLVFRDAGNIEAGTTTGTKIGTATSQKLGFWNATPIVQPVNSTAIDTLLVDTGLRASGGTANFSTAIETSSTIKTGAPTGGTAAAWKLGAVATVSPTSPNRTIEVDIGGTIYYLHAKTTND